MGCDAPVGWNQAEEDYRDRLRSEGWEQTGAVGQLSCVKCGSLVPNWPKPREKHKSWHDAIEAVLRASLPTK